MPLVHVGPRVVANRYSAGCHARNDDDEDEDDETLRSVSAKGDTPSNVSRASKISSTAVVVCCFFSLSLLLEDANPSRAISPWCRHEDDHVRVVLVVTYTGSENARVLVT